MYSRLIIVALIYIAAGCGNSDDVSAPMGNGNESEFLGRWVSRASLPTPRQEMPHAVLDGKIYVPGGIDQNRNGSTVVEVYTPATNSWSVAAPLLEAA